MTKRTYYTDDSLNAKAEVTSIYSPNAVILDQTIFAPKGGGQKCDVGHIDDHQVVGVEQVDDEIVHFVESHGLSIGDQVTLRVAEETRLINSRYHSAGHLLAAVVESMLEGATAVGGHHWPGEARVDFASIEQAAISDDFHGDLEEQLGKAIDCNLRLRKTNGDPPPRTVAIDEFAAVPCGGTHVAALGEIGSVLIRKIRWRKGKLRIGYSVA